MEDVQKGRPARPQQARGRRILLSVRGASERRENKAGGVFQHPVREVATGSSFMLDGGPKSEGVEMTVEEAS
jgi:hypothetical protein